MQNRVNIAGRSLLLLEEPARFSLAWHQGTWYLIHSLMHEDCLWLLNCLYKQCNWCWTPAFPLRSGILVHAGQRVLIWPAPSKNLGCWVHMGFLQQKHWTHVAAFFVAGIESTFVSPHQMEELLEQSPCMGFSRFQLVSFPFADPIVYLCAIISFSPKSF